MQKKKPKTPLKEYLIHQDDVMRPEYVRYVLEDNKWDATKVHSNEEIRNLMDEIFYGGVDREENIMRAKMDHMQWRYYLFTHEDYERSFHLCLY